MAKNVVAQTIREFFTAHERTVVSFHWRFDRMPAASREAMSLPRTARISHGKVVFGPHQSEIAISSFDHAQVKDGVLGLSIGGMLIVAYRPANDGKTPGQLAYEADVALRPTYDKGEPRKLWDALGPLERSTWEKNPTPRGRSIG